MNFFMISSLDSPLYAAASSLNCLANVSHSPIVTLLLLNEKSSVLAPILGAMFLPLMQSLPPRVSFCILNRPALASLLFVLHPHRAVLPVGFVRPLFCRRLFFLPHP